MRRAKAPAIGNAVRVLSLRTGAEHLHFSPASAVNFEDFILDNVSYYDTIVSVESRSVQDAFGRG
jgi:hypothetical protein